MRDSVKETIEKVNEAKIMMLAVFDRLLRLETKARAGELTAEEIDAISSVTSEWNEAVQGALRSARTA